MLFLEVRLNQVLTVFVRKKLFENVKWVYSPSSTDVLKLAYGGFRTRSTGGLNVVLYARL